MSSPLDRVRHAAGAIMTDGGSGGGWTVVGETLQCVHCGGHWLMQPGSGHERGFCTRCMGVVCGERNCWECVPQEQMLENIEADWHRRMQAATDVAEQVTELVRVDSAAEFDSLIGSAYQQLEKRARLEANIRAIRGI